MSTAPHHAPTATLTQQHLALSWPDGHQSLLAFDWLRDNCTCPQCRHTNGQKLFNITDLPEQLDLHSFKVEQRGLTLEWMDGHISHYTIPWLEQHDLSQQARQRRLAQQSPVSLWTMLPQTEWPIVAWQTLCDSTQAEAQWLQGFHRYGFGLISGVPVQEGMVAQVGDRLGHVRVTNYGRFFDVRSVPDPNNLADTALGLSVHSDNPYRHPSPGVQLLHCLIADAPGGDTQLVDGFACAHQLRQEQPDAFNLLAQWPMTFRYRNATTELQARQHLITVDPDGTITAVHFNNRSSFFLDIPEHLAAPWYAAYRAFASLLNNPVHQLLLHLNPGDCIVMQNDRTLHGRTAFNPQVGPRLLQGCYIDIDAMRSRSGVLGRA